MPHAWTLLLASCAVAVAQYVVLQPSIGYVYPTQVSQPSQHSGYYYERPAGVPAPAPAGYAPSGYAPSGDGFPQIAECLLVASTGSSVSGELRLSQAAPGSPLRVQGTVYGLQPGPHGFHLHRDASTDDDCKAAGPHFNPHEKQHGAPSAAERHAGDMGNIDADGSGVATVDASADLLSLEPGSAGYAVGHTFVVHEKVDDLGLGGDEESLKTGNAGGRLACCVVSQRY